MTELKPCPFCGGKAIATGHSGHYGVTCEKCTANIYDYATKDLAAEAWNNRTPKTVVNQYGNNSICITNDGTLNLTI